MLESTRGQPPLTFLTILEPALNWSCVTVRQTESPTFSISNVTRVRFMLKDNCLVSIGGNDKTVIVWATDFGGDHECKAEFFKNTGIDLSQ